MKAPDLNECWCCGVVVGKYHTLCYDCSEANCNRFTDTCRVRD